MTSFPIIEETYKFDCTLCGNCCTGRQQVSLDLFDLWKMGRFLGFETTRVLFDKNFVRLVQNEHDVWIPQIHFKKKPFEFCPFLINERNDNGAMKGRCQLHPDHKPLICLLAPAGRIVDLELEQEEFVLVPPALDCPGMEINRINRLKDLQIRYKQTLEIQMRFFKILNQLKENQQTNFDFYQQFYVFSLTKPFIEILSEKESQSIQRLI